MPCDVSCRRLILAGMAGKVMEWYDISVYGYFVATPGRRFFPCEDATASLLAAFGVLAGREGRGTIARCIMIAECTVCMALLLFDCRHVGSDGSCPGFIAKSYKTD
jgi:hypothetical protein